MLSLGASLTMQYHYPLVFECIVSNDHRVQLLFTYVLTETIRKHYATLVDQINPKDIASGLFSEGIISDSERDRALSAGTKKEGAMILMSGVERTFSSDDVPNSKSSSIF